MADHAVKSIEAMTSEFIVSTCQLLPKSDSLTLDHMHDLFKSAQPAPKTYTIVCGSFAEFYIRPLNTCITDIDFLICLADQLAYCGDSPVLPSDLSGLADTIECCKIESCDRYPGFVRLRVLCEMNYDWNYKKYEFKQTSQSGIYGIYINLDMATVATRYVAHYPHIGDRSYLPNVVTGPAINSQNKNNLNELGNDVVKALFCPEWPRDAKNWVIRPRKYDWPTADAISEIVHKGCHVVYSQHRSCRDDKQQWRLSFSVAEVILLQSLTKIQQIVYHLLRFFSKKVLIQKDCPKEDEVLCPYHLKTLMLWTCEEMSPEWWNSSSAITICCELLIKLSIWLKSRYYPNYFIPEANLFHDPSNATMLEETERRLNEFCNSAILCYWFIENYILPITRTQFKFLNTKKVLYLSTYVAPFAVHTNQRRLLCSTTAVPYFMDYLLPFLEMRKTLQLLSLNLLLCVSCSSSHQKCRHAIKRRFTSGLRLCLRFDHYGATLNAKVHSTMTYLPTIEKVLCFKYYQVLLHILHTAYGLRYGEISWDGSLFVEFVNAVSMQPKIIRSRHHNFPKVYSAQSCRFQFLRAQGLMRNLTGSNSHSEFLLLSLMSKASFRKALEYDDSKSNGIAPAALVYLAALHFATSEYQQAIRLCLEVLVGETSQEHKETLNAACLLFIDDVARIVGLCVLHKKITENNLHYTNGRLYIDMRLSTEVFANYLTALSAEKMSMHLDFYHELPDSTFPMDEYMKAFIKPRFVIAANSGTRFNATREIEYRRTDSLTETESAILNPLIVDALMECALENMTSFYNAICNDFGIQCSTVDCYRALYRYNCHQYEEVLQLCERILCESDLQSDLKKFAFANVLLLPPFDSFFDGDVQSLLGFHTLFYYLSPLNDIMGKVEVTVKSTFAHWFARDVCFHRRTELSESLKNPVSAIKCHYFLGRHFLARYLKLRCFIDCNLPYSEAMTEFAAEKTTLPFEHIIRRFLLRNV